MKKTLLLGILLNVTFFAFKAYAAFSGSGAGSYADPYQITSANQLNEVKSCTSSSYKLMNDIDLTSWITTI